jgi:gliding motility-associated-like protein
VKRSKIWQLLLAAVLFAQLSVAQCINTFPYGNSFESNITGWTTGGTASDWAWGKPTKSLINTTPSGTKCWITGGLSNSAYNNGEQAWLETPCFNFTNITYPYVAFMVFWETERNYDGAVMEYSVNNGSTWQKAGSINDASNCLNANWYNTASVRYLNNGNGWSGSVQGGGGGCASGGGSGSWVLAKHTFPALGGRPNVRFRFLFGAGTSCNGYNGFAIDDFFVGEAPPNQADFSFGCTNGNTVNFTNASTGCPVYSWNFGDPASGAANVSSAKNPSHTYNAAGTYTVSLTASGPDNAPSTITKTVTLLDLSVQILTSPNCNGDKNGTAVVSHTPNIGAVSYSWNTVPAQNMATATNLGAGTYVVTVSGTGVCTSQDNITITEPVAITNQVTITQPTCANNNGAVQISSSGGTGPYTYAWNPSVSSGSSATGLATGNYSVIVKDKNNCSVTETIVLNSGTPLNTNVLSKKDVTCWGNKNGSITVGIDGGTGPYEFTWSPYGGNAQTAINLGGGTFTLTIKDKNGCITTSTSTIIEPAQLVATMSKTDATCNSNNGTATATITGGLLPYSYSWAPGNYNTASINSLAPDNYYLTVTDNNGCKVSSSVTIAGGSNTLNLQMTHLDAVCHGTSTGTAGVTVSGGKAPYTYAWNNGQTSSNISNLLAGTYSVVVKDALGCTGTASVVVGEAASITVNMQATDAVCNNGFGNISTTVVGGATPYTYLWTPGATNTAGISATAGTYTVTVTDANGCKATNSAIIKEPTAISFDVVTDPATCGLKNGAAYFKTTPTGGAGALSYLWVPGNQTDSRIDNLSTGDYTVTLKDASNCQATKAFKVTTNHEGPVALTLSSTDATCFGTKTGTATAIASGGNDITLGNLGYTYTWSNGATGSTINNLGAGTYNVIVKSNSSGCLHNGTVTIRESPLMTVTTNATNPLCNGGTGNITSTVSGGAGGYQYAWTPGNYTSANISNAVAGSYQLKVTDAKGCSITNTATITQPSLLVSSINITQPSCSVSGGSATLQVSGGTIPYTYLWTPGNATTNTVSNLPAGNYTVKATDKNGCSTQQSAVINSFNSIVVQVSKTDVSCFNGTNGTASIAVSGGQSPYNIKWSTGSTNNAINNLTSADYSVVITDATNCMVTKNVSILQPEKITIQLTSKAALCESATGSIASNVAGGQSPYQYNWQPGSSTNAQLQNIVAGTYTVEVKDNNGCTVTSTTTVGSVNPLKINLGNDTSVCINANDKIVLTPGNFSSYLWQDGSTASSYTVLKDGSVWVNVKDQNGCNAIDSIVIKADCGDIYFPTAFTPNADGKNDWFGPLGNLSILTDFELVVYNRWGQRVFYSSNPFIKWNGRVGNEMIIGTYVWHARYSSRYGNNITQNGTVVLIR